MDMGGSLSESGIESMISRPIDQWPTGGWPSLNVPVAGVKEVTGHAREVGTGLERGIAARRRSNDFKGSDLTRFFPLERRQFGDVLVGWLP